MLLLEMKDNTQGPRVGSRDQDPRPQAMAKEINDRFRAVRLKADLTQKEFAKKLKVARTSVASVENYSQHITIAHMRELRFLFKVDLNWLICGEEAKPEEVLAVRLDAANREIEQLKERIEELTLNNAALRAALTE